MRIVRVSHDEVTPLFCMDTTGQQKLTETWRQESPNKGRVRMVTEEPGRREGRRCCSPICRWGGSPVLSHREQKAGKQGEKGRSRETTESCSSEKLPNIWEDRQAHEQNYLVEAWLHSSFLRGNKLNPAWFKCPILSARHSRKDNIQKTVISLLWYRLGFFSSWKCQNTEFYWLGTSNCHLAYSRVTHCLVSAALLLGAVSGHLSTAITLTSTEVSPAVNHELFWP